MSEIKESNQIRFTGSAPIDAKLTPVDTKEELDEIPLLQRYRGMTVLVKGDTKNDTKEYWLKDDVKTWVEKKMEADVSGIDCGQY